VNVYSRMVCEATPPLALALVVPTGFLWSPLACRLSLAVSAVLVTVALVVARDAARRRPSRTSSPASAPSVARPEWAAA
jgi:membrane protein implicated in regulation of membrane protease activity